MIICRTVVELQKAIDLLKTPSGKIGFVPTMGALHSGHLSLIQQSATQNEVTVCSIFVNPTQFNNTEDLIKYPRTPDKDIALIENFCQILFMPSEKEIYPEKVSETYNFGSLETVMEGVFRPGHFNGVALVVNRLFAIVRPDRAYFGEKDFQQLQIIKAMTRQLQLPVDVVSCPIIRESNGLAMSSRNARLSEDDRKLAANIYKILNTTLQKSTHTSPENIKNNIYLEFEKFPQFKIEYIEIAEELTLQTVCNFPSNQKVRIFIAVWLGGVRLIDNQVIN
jgi:pantoate--beta-alanine ligase